jgi:hypothetical protein
MFLMCPRLFSTILNVTEITDNAFDIDTYTYTHTHAGMMRFFDAANSLEQVEMAGIWEANREEAKRGFASWVRDRKLEWSPRAGVLTRTAQ